MSSAGELFETCLPHGRPMLMLSDVLQQDEHTIHCTSIIEVNNPLLIDGHFPVLGGLELLAQASGVMLGLLKSGQKPGPGVIARIRALQITETTIPVGSKLHIHARFTAGNRNAALVEGRIQFNQQTFCHGSLMLATLTNLTL